MPSSISNNLENKDTPKERKAVSAIRDRCVPRLANGIFGLPRSPPKGFIQKMESVKTVKTLKTKNTDLN